jgi:peptide chain release factor 1
MKSSLLEKLETLTRRYEKLGQELSIPEVLNDQNRYRQLSKEYADIEPIVRCFQDYKEDVAAIENAKTLLTEDDDALKELAKAEIETLESSKKTFEKTLMNLLLPKDVNDERNVYLEVRAGTGGLEAALFAADLYRMYIRFAQLKQWTVETISSSESEQGGYKEIIAKISGHNVYAQLKFESGAHRVQRVPVTESQGRIHTSACTVAVLPEAQAIDHIDINPSDLRIDTFRSSGAGGQHVNTTDSAIRITHIPSGLVVECQDERSQHKNRAKAMSLLQAKLLMHERQKQAAEMAAKRKSLIGTGDRSERIRTYNFPQSRLTDHRINLTLYKLNEILEGNLQEIIDALTRELQAEQLAELNES